MKNEKIDILNNVILYDTCIKIINQFEKESLNNILKKKELYLEKISTVKENRNKNGSKIYSSDILNSDKLRIHLLRELDNWNNKKNIEYFFYLIKSNDFFHFKDKDFSDSFNKSPSIISNILINFIIRIIEIDQMVYKINNATFNPISIKSAYNELINNIRNKKFNYVMLVQLFGVTGNIDEINIENIKIRKIDQNVAKIFNSYRHNKESYNFVYPGEYYMEIREEANKQNFMSVLNNKIKIVDKAFKLISLSTNGYIKRGNVILNVSDWTIKNKYSKTFHREFLFNENKYPFLLDNQAEDNLKKYYKFIFFNTNEPELCLQKSIKKIIKSKEKSDIEDKITELAFALEYSLETKIGEIQKFLKNKSKLLYQINFPQKNSKEIEETIVSFYKLRSKIFHGLDEVKESPENLKLIKNAEEIIRNNILLLLKLNQTYSLELINETLEMVLNENSYNSNSRNFIRNNNKIKNEIQKLNNRYSLETLQKELKILLKNNKISLIEPNKIKNIDVKFEILKLNQIYSLRAINYAFDEIYEVNLPNSNSSTSDKINLKIEILLLLKQYKLATIYITKYFEIIKIKLSEESYHSLINIFRDFPNKNEQQIKAYNNLKNKIKFI